ncbi:facilitated trehalose transporter Tret1-2 homolog [Macrosteles quadrilineatus]|uniref:facilitated trehalose transporter Tret1-2 homolog n=1 Tax=Macrosteles quadrilineatus TaxID=74068 RepID=UPI0023E2A3F1|nr:facilitated trehalose transporter Tret1-2 homolog [Macrosteles quadrilineatus]
MVYIKTGSLKEGMINQYMAAISGSLAYGVVGASTGWPSPVLIEMDQGKTPLKLNVTQISWMVSLMFLGHISSPIPAGYLMRYFGRKKVCLYLSVFPLLSWLLIYYAYHVTYLYIARYLAGLWIGITSTIMPIYVGEISSTGLRSSLTTVNNLMTNFGILFAYVVGPYVNYFLFAVICEIMTVVYICSFIMMPESPHFYLQTGQRKEALIALSWLRKGETEENIEKEIKSIEQGIEKQKLQKGSLRDIFCHKANRKGFALSVTYAIFKRLSGSGVMQAYLSITLPPVSVGVLNANNSVIIIGLTSLISSIFSAGLAVKYRRRILLTISCGGCSIATSLVALWFYLDEFTTIDVSHYTGRPLMDRWFISVTILTIRVKSSSEDMSEDIFTSSAKSRGVPLKCHVLVVVPERGP